MSLPRPHSIYSVPRLIRSLSPDAMVSPVRVIRINPSQIYRIFFAWSYPPAKACIFALASLGHLADISSNCPGFSSSC